MIGIEFAFYTDKKESKKTISVNHHFEPIFMTKNIENNFIPIDSASLVEVLDMLKENGMDNEFILNENGKLEGMGQEYTPQDLKLVHTFHFKRVSKKSENTVLYLLEDREHNRGYIMDVYGSDSRYGAAFSEFLKEIPEKK